MKPIYYISCSMELNNPDRITFGIARNDNYTERVGLSALINSFHKASILICYNLDWLKPMLLTYCLKRNLPPNIFEHAKKTYYLRIGSCEFRDIQNILNFTYGDLKKTYGGATLTLKDQANLLQKSYATYMHNIGEVFKAIGAERSYKYINNRLTLAAIAFSAFRELSPFNQCCPRTTGVEYDYLFRAYCGGLRYHIEGTFTHVHQIDANGGYPTIYSSYPLPYGKGYDIGTVEELKAWQFYIGHFLIRFDLKPGAIPCIGRRMIVGGLGEYYVSSEGDYLEIVACSIDIELIRELYDCDIKLISAKGYSVKANFYKRYNDALVKELEKYPKQRDPVRHQVIKDMRNSPCGKLGSQGYIENKRYYLDDNDVLQTALEARGVDEDNFYYLPQAIAINAYMRRRLMDIAKQIGYEKIVMMNTDSVKWVGDIPPGLPLHPTRDGYWKYEGCAQLMKILSPQHYATYQDGKLTVTASGITAETLNDEFQNNRRLTREEVEEFFDKKFKKGYEFSQLAAVRVSGGRLQKYIIRSL